MNVPKQYSFGVLSFWWYFWYIASWTKSCYGSKSAYGFESSQPQIILKLFLNFGRSELDCSYIVALAKRSKKYMYRPQLRVACDHKRRELSWQPKQATSYSHAQNESRLTRLCKKGRLSDFKTIVISCKAIKRKTSKMSHYIANMGLLPTSKILICTTLLLCGRRITTIVLRSRRVSGLTLICLTSSRIWETLMDNEFLSFIKSWITRMVNF